MIYLRADYVKPARERNMLKADGYYEQPIRDALKAQGWQPGDRIWKARPTKKTVRAIPFYRLTLAEQNILRQADRYGCVDYLSYCGEWKPNVKGFEAQSLTYRLNYTGEYI